MHITLIRLKGCFSTDPFNLNRRIHKTQREQLCSTVKKKKRFLEISRLHIHRTEAESTSLAKYVTIYLIPTF